MPGHHLEWFEGILWFGMTSHVGGIHLANLRMAQRMAEKVGDHEFAAKCRAWLDQGSEAMEGKMWGNGYYLPYNEPKTGKKGDAIFAYQLDGEWMCRFHGHLDQGGEIHAEMFLSAKISCPQPLDIGFIKGVELQEFVPSIGKWQTV